MFLAIKLPLLPAETMKIIQNFIRTSFKTVIFLTAALSILTSCGSKYGGLQRSHAVNQVFQDYDLLPDHNYYYYGWESTPHAIAGIHSDYVLQAPAWNPVAPTREQMQSWISKMNAVYGDLPYGAFILGPKNTKLGIWFSSLRYAKIEMDEKNQIIALSPQFIYEVGGK
jgi:hypothetical protein